LPPAYALSVGALVARKNLARVFDAVQALRTEPATADLMLIHAGPTGALAADVAAAASRPGLAGAVSVLGYVPAEDLAALYGLARFLVFPSLDEGFGLPVAEAMACGCPAITSNISALPEVAGDAALLVDPTSTDEIAGAMRRLWTDEALRNALVRRGLARAAGYRWERTAAATVAVYETASP
ncbi:MAG: glycosyltransferase family 4 protein, partial [Gemmatimonadales bacterium]